MMMQIICPHCGYKMPIFAAKDAICRGIWVRCKGRKCGKEFEIKIQENK